MSTSTLGKMPMGLRVFSTVFIIFWLIIAAFPFLWTLWGSFKVELDFFSKTPRSCASLWFAPL